MKCFKIICKQRQGHRLQLSQSFLLTMPALMNVKIKVRAYADFVILLQPIRQKLAKNGPTSGLSAGSPGTCSRLQSWPAPSLPNSVSKVAFGWLLIWCCIISLSGGASFKGLPEPSSSSVASGNEGPCSSLNCTLTTILCWGSCSQVYLNTQSVDKGLIVFKNMALLGTAWKQLEVLSCALSYKKMKHLAALINIDYPSEAYFNRVNMHNRSYLFLCSVLLAGIRRCLNVDV